LNRNLRQPLSALETGKIVVDLTFPTFLAIVISFLSNPIIAFLFIIIAFFSIYKATTENSQRELMFFYG